MSADDWPPYDVYTAVRDMDVTWVMLGYLGAIFLGPVIPLGVWLTRRRSEFRSYHAARAVNMSLTAVLYGVCCVIVGGMLALDSVTAALSVGLPLLFLLWLVMLKYLIRGVFAAQRGEPYDVPGWLCATFVRSRVEESAPPAR